MKKIKEFVGRTDLCLFGDTIIGGPIATQKAFENGETSFAHLYPNGTISRFGEAIGNIKHLELGEELPNPVPKPWAYFSSFMMFGIIDEET